jgi:hypothetical protein
MCWMERIIIVIYTMELIKCKYTNEEKNKIFNIVYKLCKIKNIDTYSNFNFFITINDLKLDGFNITKIKKLKKLLKFFNEKKMESHYNLLILLNLKYKIIEDIFTINKEKYNNVPECLINDIISNEKKKLDNQLFVLKSFTPLYYQPPINNINIFNNKQKNNNYEVILRNEIINRMIELINYFSIEILSKFGVEKITLDYALKMNIVELCYYYNETVDIIKTQLLLLQDYCYIYFNTNKKINYIIQSNII